MKQILLFGAGKSSTALIGYLLQNAPAENWQLTVADANLQAIREKVGESVYGKAVALDIQQETERKALVREADIVISLLPPGGIAPMEIAATASYLGGADRTGLRFHFRDGGGARRLRELIRRIRAA